MVIDPGPYPGLRHYEAADAPRFFGRAVESRSLASVILGNRLTLLYGASGVGKTSLLRAGVLPRFRPQDADLLPVGRPPVASAFPTGETPVNNPFPFALLSSWAPERSPSELAGLTVAGFLGDLAAGVDRYGIEVPLVAVIDQFEDVFNDAPHWEDGRARFLDELAAALRDVPRLHLVLAMREDAMGDVLPHEGALARRHRARFRLGELTAEQAREAVVGPLEGTERSFGPGVADMLVERLRTMILTNAVGERHTVRERTVEPVKLQIVCSSLWQSLPAEVTSITADHLESHGDVDVALTRFCAHAVEDVARVEDIAAADLWAWLARTFITELGTRGTAYEGIADTGGMPNTVARSFEAHRILQAAKRSGSVWFELQSDGLIDPIRKGVDAVPAGGGPDRRPDGYLRMAETALADGMLGRAEEYARTAAETGRDRPRTIAEAESFLGKLALDQAKMADADERAELYGLAERHFLAATELFELQRDPFAVARLLVLLGQLFAEMRRYADAVSMIQSALSRSPGDMRAQLELARVLEEAGQVQPAIAAYSRVLVTAPDHVDALLARGRLAAAHGDADAALADVDDAVRLRPSLDADRDVQVIRRRAQERLDRRS